MENVCCLVLAAGEGKRMKSNIPKVLSLVLFEPMIGWVINSVVRCNISDICVVTGYKYELVQEYLMSLGCNFESVVQNERKGTAHAVMMARNFLNRYSGGDVLILNGDAPFIDKATITKAYKTHKSSNNSATIISARLENPCGYGRIIRSSVDYDVKAIVEEQDTSFSQRSIKEVNSGAYWFKIDCLLKYLEKITDDTAQNEYYLTSIIKLLIEAGHRVDAFETSSADIVLGANDTSQLQRLNEIARYKVIDGLMENGVKIACKDGIIVGKWVQIGAGTSILPGTIITGKSIIGKECVIGPNTHVIDCKIGDGAVVHSSYCKDSIILENQQIGPFTSLIDSNMAL